MKIICIGLNYRDHAREMNRPLPDEPLVFLKADSALLKKNKPFFLPAFSADIHYEAEIVLHICKLGKTIAEKYAHRYYDSITLGIDMTARDLQASLSSSGMPWEISKSFDGAAPLGEFIAVDEAGDPDNISFRLEKNGIRVQDGNTGSMIFGFDRIISHVSRFFTLKTGDLIFTGTPAGVGPVKRGDRLTGYIGENRLIDFMIK
ncbi:MAG: fumarylacetoacetate hydrolase family protein [Bacteroidales bacterium]|jgi:2-keto-4-pentenoate hydratase/2-oxohepta-3-ene-1,7-dioic acid hydratase in catechol pathway|nr:fumarylacetoacetate hydrolase family protein [Bacteroidales bacterium]